MRIRMMAGVFGAAMMLAPAALQAQTPATPTQAPTGASAPVGTGPRGDIELGVTPIDSQRDRGVTNSYRGWEGGISYRVFHDISIYAEGSGEYRSAGGFTSTLYAYGGGARFESDRDQRVKPFAQVFLGTGLDNGRTIKAAAENHYPVLAPGGGLDLKAASRLAVRIRLDFPLDMSFGPDVYKGTRVVLSIAVPYGHR